MSIFAACWGTALGITTVIGLARAKRERDMVELAAIFADFGSGQFVAFTWLYANTEHGKGWLRSLLAALLVRGVVEVKYASDGPHYRLRPLPGPTPPEAS